MCTVSTRQTTKGHMRSCCFRGGWVPPLANPKQAQPQFWTRWKLRCLLISSRFCICRVLLQVISQHISSQISQVFGSCMFLLFTGSIKHRILANQLINQPIDQPIIYPTSSSTALLVAKVLLLIGDARQLVQRPGRRLCGCRPVQWTPPVSVGTHWGRN